MCPATESIAMPWGAMPWGDMVVDSTSVTVPPVMVARSILRTVASVQNITFGAARLVVELNPTTAPTKQNNSLRNIGHPLSDDYEFAIICRVAPASMEPRWYM